MNSEFSRKTDCSDNLLRRDISILSRGKVSIVLITRLAYYVSYDLECPAMAYQLRHM